MAPVEAEELIEEEGVVLPLVEQVEEETNKLLK
jgi:hypothetical protein